MSFNRRSSKKRMNVKAKKLALNSFAIGCRGHVGIIIEKSVTPRDPHGASVTILSLIDGVEESCSMLHCSPSPVTGEYARWASNMENHILEGFRHILKWCSTFDDFCEYYTAENFEQDKLKHYQEFREFEPQGSYQKAIYEILRSDFEKMRNGEPFSAPEIYPFQKYRSGKARPQDFSTISERTLISRD